MKNGWSSRRPDMTYESCCAKISVVVHSSSTRRRPSSPKALESPRVSKLTSSSSTCLAPLLHPEILCSSSFTSVTCLCRQHVHSLSVNPLDIHRLYSHMDSLRNFIRRLKGKDPENVQNNLTQTSGLKTETVMFSQSPLFSHMDSD